MATSRGGDKGLVGRRKRFADEYLVCLNGTEAYKRAGYKAKNDHVASVEASKLLAKPDVKAYVEERQKTVADKLGITQERVLLELKRLAFSDPRSVATWGPNGVELRDSKKLTDDEAASLAEVSEKTGQFGSSMSFKMHDKKAALESLAKHLGLTPDKVEHNLGESFASLVALAASKRAGAK